MTAVLSGKGKAVFLSSHSVEGTVLPPQGLVSEFLEDKGKVV